MRLTLIGADFEENLGVGMIAAAAEHAGHAVRIVPFNDPASEPAVVRAALATRPDVIGLSIQFQHRAHEFLSLARSLRAAGFDGHLTCGGHFPTLAYAEVLRHGAGFDSVVLHDGERTIVELLDALSAHTPLSDVSGLALRASDGAPMRTAGRPLGELDALPFPHRYRPHARHAGVPFIPILGSRGCWGACSYCSITSFYRDARAHAGSGHTLRLRSPENVAAEMAILWHGAGPSVFCFHDDNLLLPRPDDTLARLRAIRASLDAYGVGQIGIIGKCRPDTLTPALARELRRLGVIRLYVGVENVAEAGSAHLNRRTQTSRVGAALDACRQADIFVCYNLLVFEPDATLDDIAENIAFIRAHADHPVNFCRAEPYHGTPLHRGLAARSQPLGGSFLGWNYRITDDRTELLFRIASAAFRQRNFDPDGVGNRYMGLGYTAQLLSQFYGEDGGRLATLREQAHDLTRSIALETADFLDEARILAGTVDLADRDRIERETGLLGLRIAAADARRHRELDEVIGGIETFAARAASPLRPRLLPSPPRALAQLVSRVALGASIFGATVAASGCEGIGVNDPVPPDIQVVDPVPQDMARRDMMVVDPLPVDMATRDVMVADPPPPDLGMQDLRMPDLSRADRPGPVDPPPPPMDQGPPFGLNAPRPQHLPILDQWRQTTPDDAVRTRDLPLYAPPKVKLAARRHRDEIAVSIDGGSEAIGVRWEGEGLIVEPDGEGGRRVAWHPRGPDDQIRAGIRSRGGVTVLALRARDVS